MVLEQREDINEILSARELFTLVRDIPFFLGVDSTPESLIKDNKGGCTRKHLFLAPRLKEMGYKVNIEIARFDWRELPIPDKILSLLKQPIQYHMFLYLNKDGRSTIVDATWDKEMGKKGFPLNEWNDHNEMKLCINPIDLHRTALPVLQVRSLVSESIKKVTGLLYGPQKTPFNDAFNRWLGR